MSRDYIPERESAFDEWQKMIIVLILANVIKWKLPEPTGNAPHERTAPGTNATDDLLYYKNLFDDAYAKVINPATKTPATVTAKNDAKKAYISSLRDYIQVYIAKNHEVSDEDRRAMGLTIYKKTRTPVGIPTTIPSLDLDVRKGHRVIIKIHDEDGNKKRPVGLNGACIAWLVSDEPVTEHKKLTGTALATRTPFTLQLNDEDRNKIVYIAACWENTKGEKGQWCDILNAIVS